VESFFHVLIAFAFFYGLSWATFGGTFDRFPFGSYVLTKKHPHHAVFIHSSLDTTTAMVDVDAAAAAYGANILSELVLKIDSSGLLQRIDGVYITVAGPVEARAKVINTISSLELSNSCKFPHVSRRVHKDLHHQERCKIELATKIHIVGDSATNNTQLNFPVEFPVLSAVQYFAGRIHNRSKLLFMHTEGIREGSTHSSAMMYDHLNDWRRYVTYFMIERYSTCWRVLRTGHYDTCGVLKEESGYTGNSWWTTAEYLSNKRPKVHELNWSFSNRFAVQQYVLGNLSRQEKNRHYCVHHTHHDMLLCPTAREMYENISLAIRETSECLLSSESVSSSGSDNPTVTRIGGGGKLCHATT
jgi:hypothetical protein